MTVLSICQEIADELALIQPTTIVGNTEETARRLRASTQAAGKWLRDNYDWAVLTEEHTFTSSSSTASYALPSDFYRIKPSTQWNRTDNWHMDGPLTPERWQFFKGAIAAKVGIRTRWRIKPDSGTKRFYIENPGTGGDTIAFEYISKNWALTAAGAGISAWSADTDNPKFEQQLVKIEATWRALRASGFPYQDEKRDARREIDAHYGRERGGGQILNMAGMERFGLTANLPDTGFGS